MTIERELRDFFQRFDDWGSYGQVWDKVSIHHIDVEEIGSTTLDSSHLIGQVGKISRKD